MNSDSGNRALGLGLGDRVAGVSYAPLSSVSLVVSCSRSSRYSYSDVTFPLWDKDIVTLQSNVIVQRFCTVLLQTT